MSTLELPVSSELNSFEFQIDLEAIVYTLRFHYNLRLARWIMSIADSIGNDLLNGIILLTNVDLIRQYVKEGLPPGQFYMINEADGRSIAGQNDLGNDVKLIYIESEDNG